MTSSINFKKFIEEELYRKGFEQIESMKAAVSQDMGNSSDEDDYPLSETRRYTKTDDDQNIIMQLRSAEDLDGAKEIKFRRGSKKFDKKSISTILKFHDSLKMPQDKRKFRIMVFQSPEQMEQIVKAIHEKDM